MEVNTEERTTFRHVEFTSTWIHHGSQVLKIADELRQIVCASGDLESTLSVLRTKYIAALAVGCRLDRVDRTVGGPPLKTLISEAGDSPLHGPRSKIDAGTRDVAIKELSCASQGFRRLVIDAMLHQMRSELEATKHATQPWYSEFDTLTKAMASELRSMSSWRVADGERITAPPKLVATYDALVDLSDKITNTANTLRPTVARTLAVTGTPLKLIGEVVGGNARSFGYRYRDWREFGRPVRQVENRQFSEQELPVIAAIVAGAENLRSLTRNAIRTFTVDENLVNRTFFAR